MTSHFILLTPSFGSVTRDNGRLDVAVTIQHVLQHVLQTRQWRFPSDVVVALNFAFGDQGKCLADTFRRVMERCLERDFRIVQPLGIEFHFGAIRTTTKEIDGAAFADHINRPLPSRWTTHAFDNDIRAALVGC